MKIGIESVFRDFGAYCDEAADSQSIRANIFQTFALGGSGVALYGFVLGLQHSVVQGVSAAVKLPLLFLLALLITLPAFHFIGLHAGSRSRFQQTLAIIGAGISVTGVLLVAFIPIAGFFWLSGSSYQAMVLIHVAVLAFCGGSGVMSIHRGILSLARRHTEGMNSTSAEFCLYAWSAIFAFVGAQLAWLMRPFLGASGEFVLFTGGGGDFFSAVFKALLGTLK